MTLIIIINLFPFINHHNGDDLRVKIDKPSDLFLPATFYLLDKMNRDNTANLESITIQKQPFNNTSIFISFSVSWDIITQISMML